MECAGIILKPPIPHPHPHPQSAETLSSWKPVPGADKVGDHWPEQREVRAGKGVSLL